METQEPVLKEQDRTKLDGIVEQMKANKESDESIQLVVNDFKTKYATKSEKPAETAEPVKKKETSNLAVSPSGSLETKPQPEKSSTPSESDTQPAPETIFETIFGISKKKKQKKSFAEAPNASDVADEKGSLVNTAEEKLTKGKSEEEKSKVREKIVNLRNNFFNGTLTADDMKLLPGDPTGLTDSKTAEAINNKTKNLKVWGNITVMKGINFADMNIQSLNGQIETLKKAGGDNTDEIQNLENKKAFLNNSITQVYNAEADKTSGELITTLKNSLGGPIKYDPYTNTLDEKSQFYVRKSVDDYLNAHPNDVINYKTSGKTSISPSITHSQGKLNYPDIANRVISYFNTVIPVQKAHDKVAEDIMEKYPSAKPLISHIQQLNEQFSPDQVGKADAYIKANQDKGFLGVNERYFGQNGALSTNTEFLTIQQKYQQAVKDKTIPEDVAMEQMQAEIKQNKSLKKIYDNYTKDVTKVQNDARKQWEGFMINGLKKIDPALTMYKNGNVGVEGLNQEESKKIIDEYNNELVASTAKTLHDQHEKLNLRADEKAKRVGAFGTSFVGAINDLQGAFTKYWFDKTGWGGQAVEMYQAKTDANVASDKSDEARKWNWSGMKSLADFNFYKSALGAQIPLFGGAAAVTAATRGAGLPEYVGWLSAAGLFDASMSIEQYNEIALNGRDKFGNKLTEHDASVAAAQNFKSNILPDMLFAAANLGVLSRAKNLSKPTLLKTLGSATKGLTVGAIPVSWQGYNQYATQLEAEGKTPDLWDYAQDGKLAHSLIEGIAGGAFLQLAHTPAEHIRQTENWKRMIYTGPAEFNSNSMFNALLGQEIAGRGNQFRDAIKMKIATEEMTPEEKEDVKNDLLYSTALERNIKGGGIDVTNVAGAYQAHSLALGDLHDQWSKANEGNPTLAKIYSEQATDFRKQAKDVMEGKGKYMFLEDKTGAPIFISDQSFKVLDADGKIAEWIKTGTIEGVHSSTEPGFDADYKEKIKAAKSPDVEAPPVKEPEVEADDQTKVINAFKDHADDLSGSVKLMVDGAIGDPKLYEDLTKGIISQAIDHPTLIKEQVGNEIWKKIEPIVNKSRKESEALAETERAKKEQDAKPEPSKSVPEPEEKSEPTRQEKVNDVVDLKTKYNALRKNDPEKASALNELKLKANELGLQIKDIKGFAEVLSSGGKPVQRKFEGNKAEAKDFDPKNYDPRTVSLVKSLADNDAYLTGLGIDGANGIAMSEKQKAAALDDIRNGRNTIGAKAVHDALEAMVKSGFVEVRDPATGRRDGIPVDEYLEIQKSDDELSIDEVNTMLIGGTLSDDEFENFKNYIEDEQSGAGTLVQEPDPGKTEKSAKNAGPDKETKGGGSETPAAERVKGIVDKARSLADKIRKADITGAGGVAAKSDITAIPREIIASAIDGFAAALEGGAKAVAALKEAIKFIKDNFDFKGEDKELENYLRGQLAGEVPELGADFDKPESKGSLVSADDDTQAKVFNEPEPKTLKTGGGFKSTFVRGLERLASIEKALGTQQEALQSAYKASGPKGGAQEVITRVARAMEKAFGSKSKGNEVYTNLRKVLVQSNLNGLRDRWNDWSNHFRKSDTEEIKKWATDPKYAEKNGLPEMEFITDRMERDSHFRGMTTAAKELVGRNNFDGLKDLMAINFNRAAQLVQNLDWSEGKSYDEMRQDPEIQKAKGIYYKEFGKEVEAAHAALGGTMRDYLGEEGVYYPLNEITPEEGEQKRKWFQKRSPLAKSSTPNNDFATGFLNNYDVSVASMKDRVTSAFKARDKNAMIDVFKTEGYMVPFENGAKENVINISGNYVPAVKMNINDGTNLRPAYYLVPEGVAEDIRGLIFGKNNQEPPGAIKRTISNITGFINKTTLSTPIEALRHTTNLLFRMNKNTPYAFDGNLATKAVGAIPIVKNIMQLGHLSFMDPTAEKWQNTLHEMAVAGEIPDKYGKSSFNKDWAEMTGGEKATWWKANFGPLLYGTSGIDIRARMMLWDISKGMNPNASPNEIRKVMSSLGDYNKGLQSEVVKVLKEQTGLAPFIVSQQARLRAGIEAYNFLPKYSGLPLEGLPEAKKILYHTLNLMQSSVYGFVGLWAASYLAKTGDNPFTTPGSRLGVIPGVNDNDEGPGSISLGAFYTAANVGTKITGMDAFFQAKSEGKDNFEAMEKGLLQSVNTTTAPVMSGSPVMHVASGLFGVAPYIVSVNDDRGQPSINFLPTTIPAPGKGQQIGVNLANDLIHVNPLVGAATDFTLKKTVGFNLEREPGKSAWKQSFYQNMLEGFFPGILVNDVNLKQQEYYQKRDEDVQQRAFQREEKKQDKDNK